ncbi:Uncharacterised protein [Bordetella pertussis]|nr:Uncharacterised protein [Bordetella pertussis]
MSVYISRLLGEGWSWSAGVVIVQGGYTGRPSSYTPQTVLIPRTPNRFLVPVRCRTGRSRHRTGWWAGN